MWRFFPVIALALALGCPTKKPPVELQPLLPPERILAAMGFVIAIDEEPPPSAGDTPVTFDVLYVRVPGTSEAGCQPNTDRMNEINTNSLVPHIRERMVGCVVLAQASTGNISTDLGQLSAVGDGRYDEVHALRDQLKADLVQMIVLTDSGGAAGIGYIGSTASSAFSVVVQQYAVGYISGPHERGHNIGMHHNRANASGCTLPGSCPTQYNFGWRNGVWRTVMSYGGENRIPFWSSPLVTCPGSVPCGTVSDDNARVMRERAGLVANFRVGASTPRPQAPVGARIVPRL